MHRVFSVCASLLIAICVSMPASPFDNPLSDEAVREAYFLGQRHDASFLSNYIKFLPPPKTGPYISCITFLTPFAQFAQFSSNYVGNYSAQQARLDHLGQKEIVEIIVEIRLTPSYGAFVPSPSGSRSSEFWKDFHVQIYDGDQSLSPSGFHGHANHSCGRRGPCVMTGATLTFEFPADAFTSESATFGIDPPEGDPVSVDFDLPPLTRLSPFDCGRPAPHLRRPMRTSATPTFP